MAGPSDFVSEVMHTHDNDAFASREPTAKHIFRVPKHPIGIHQRWSADGHDKLYKIGFPIWAIVDDATGRWLDGWVVPSNRMGDIVAYLFLCAVEKYGGTRLRVIFAIADRYLPSIIRNTIAVQHRLWIRDNQSVWISQCLPVSFIQQEDFYICL
jgi:hypothetical protein